MSSVEIFRGPRWHADVLISALEANNIRFEAVHASQEFYGEAGYSVVRVDEHDSEAARGLNTREIEWRSGDFGDDEYIDISPRLKRKIQRIDSRDFLRVLKEYAERHHSHGMDRLLGKLALSHDDLDLAQAVLTQLVEKWPEDPTLRMWLGLFFYETGHPSDATPIFDSLVESHPDSPHGWVGRALVAASSDAVTTVDDAVSRAFSLVDPSQHRVTGERLAALLAWRGFIADAEQLYCALAEWWNDVLMLVPHALIVEHTDPQQAEAILEEARGQWSGPTAELEEFIAQERKKLEGTTREAAE